MNSCHLVFLFDLNVLAYSSSFSSQQKDISIQLSNGDYSCIFNCFSQDSLPKAHTCFNQLVLPSYSSFSVMKEKIIFAITNTDGFELAQLLIIITFIYFSHVFDCTYIMCNLAASYPSKEGLIDIIMWSSSMDIVGLLVCCTVVRVVQYWYNSIQYSSIVQYSTDTSVLLMYLTYILLQLDALKIYIGSKSRI